MAFATNLYFHDVIFLTIVMFDGNEDGFQGNFKNEMLFVLFCCIPIVFRQLLTGITCFFFCFTCQKAGSHKGKKKATQPKGNLKNSPYFIRDGDVIGVKVKVKAV